MLFCTVEGCTKEKRCAGMCWTHYERLKKYGDVNGGTRNHGPVKDRFLTKFVQGTGGECWNWSGARTSKGYGMIQEGGKGSKHLLAHRLSYEIHKGPIPDGMIVMHACDNRQCVNPAHLSAGTQSRNILDAFARGRKVNKPKLTPEQVQAIRASSASHRALAAEYGCARSLVHRIKCGAARKDV